MKKAKKIVLAIIVAMTANIAMAQSTKIHVVERGETIESIAQKYGVTKDAIVKLNPDLEQFMYVGMELTVPVVVSANATVATVSSDEKSDLPSNAFVAMTQAPANDENTSDEDSDFSNFGVGYLASFDAFDKGIYGLNSIAFFTKTIGGQLFLGTNAGLVDFDYSTFLAKIGPSYTHQLAEKVAFYVPLTIDLSWTNHPETKTVTSTPNLKDDVSRNDKQVTHEKKETKSEFGWGLSLTPSVVVKIEKVALNAGISVMWSEEAGEVDCGLMLGVGFDI